MVLMGVVDCIDKVFKRLYGGLSADIPNIYIQSKKGSNADISNFITLS